MASPQALALKQGFKLFREQALANPNQTLDQMRANAAGFGKLTADVPDVEYRDVDAGGVPAMWVVPEGAHQDRVLLYTHGGGYVFCSVETHRRLAAHIARAIGCVALVIDYRLAPEHPHPAAVTDAVTSYKWLLGRGIAAKHVALSGDSAGGGLALATALKLRDEGIALPAGVVPLSPWADMVGATETMTSREAVDMLVSPQAIKDLAALFLKGQDAREPYASPVYANYRDLCPIYVQVGDEEVLLDDARAVAEAAQSAGVDTTLDVFPEMQHVFQIAAGNLPEADEAIARIAAWLKPRLGL
ncbi:MAG: alpha/beta hydrolase [Gammaproteobacteria bacterium]|nr:alpha/beta hydrolase [Gammaproteobacteria bacterium]MBI5616723.1 alpha/beta hydrolase [Gammaproteobacteria bacterium]